MSDDIADTVESERFREILSLKKTVIDTKDEVDRAIASGKAREGAGVQLYHRKVRDYVMSVETVLNPARGETSQYWDEVVIGEFSLPDGEEKTVRGLKEFLELNTVFEVKDEGARQKSYRHKKEKVTVTKRVRPPKRLIEQAFRVTNVALDEAGFDLDEPQEKQSSEFDKVGDVEKATKILDFLRALDDDGLREVKHVINNELIDDELSNGHHE